MVLEVGDNGEQIDRAHVEEEGTHRQRALHLQEALEPALGQVDLALEVRLAAWPGRRHGEAAGADREGGLPRATHALQGRAQLPGEVDVGRAVGHRRALRLERRQRRRQARIARLVVAERLEEELVVVDGDDGIEHEGRLGLLLPAHVAQDDLVQRQQQLPQQQRLLDPPTERHRRPAQVGGKLQRRGGQGRGDHRPLVVGECEFHH